MTTKNYCINCTHYDPADGQICTCPELSPTDLVTGKPFYHTCHFNRSNPTICGEFGKHFNQKTAEVIPRD